MQLAVYLLPQALVAQCNVRLAVPADVGLLLRDGAGDSQFETPAKVGQGQLLAHSPHLLIWCLACSERITPVETLRSLVEMLPSIARCQPRTGHTVDSAADLPVMMPSSRRRKFIRSLSLLDRSRRNGDDAFARQQESVEKILARIVAQATGKSRKACRKWLSDCQITELFWEQLASQAAEAEPLVLKLGTTADDENRSGANDEADFSHRLHEAKMASLKQLAYGASHEINNPLANIASRAQTLLLDEEDRDRRIKLAKINQQAFRAHEMIADMMLFAHPPQPEIRPVDPAEIVQQVLDETRELAGQQSTDVHLNLRGRLQQVLLDPDQLAVAIRAIVQNALEAVGQGGRVTIEATSRPEEQITEFCVSDDGPGFRDSQLPHVFDPFYSGREAGRGLGFGLSKAWRITQLHDGEISAENAAAGGARVRIRIPYRFDAA